MNTTPWNAAALAEAEEKKVIQRDANFTGWILLALVAGQLVVGTLLGVASVFKVLDFALDDYGLGSVGYCLFNMLQYILYVGVPVLVVALCARREANPFPTRRVPRGTYGIAVFGGMAIAVLANYISGYVMQFFSALGVPYPEMPDRYDPTLLNLALNLIGTALLPALLEEMAMRGYILGSLQKHGKAMAVVVSSVLFGLIHGNLLQLPFAFILGLILGWLTVQTGSIWPAVVFHFANNACSTVLGWAEQFIDGDGPTVLSFLVFCVLGTAVCLAMFFGKPQWKDDLLRPMGNGASVLPLSKRVKAIFTAPVFLVGGIVWILLLIVASLSL